MSWLKNPLYGYHKDRGLTMPEVSQVTFKYQEVAW
jgi:hypothetical protein